MKTAKSEGKYAYDGLERVFHEKTRLSIIASLFASRKGRDFNELKALCGLTDGNLSRHLQVLKAEGIIKIRKGYINNKPNTHCSITGEGREKFSQYLEELEKVIKDAKAVAMQSEGFEEGLAPAT